MCRGGCARGIYTFESSKGPRACRWAADVAAQRARSQRPGRTLFHFLVHEPAFVNGFCVYHCKFSSLCAYLCCMCLCACVCFSLSLSLSLSLSVCVCVRAYARMSDCVLAQLLNKSHQGRAFADLHIEQALSLVARQSSSAHFHSPVGVLKVTLFEGKSVHAGACACVHIYMRVTHRMIAHHASS